jgi:hypothetical protein
MTTVTSSCNRVGIDVLGAALANDQPRGFSLARTTRLRFEHRQHSNLMLVMTDSLAGPGSARPHRRISVGADFNNV